MFGRTPRSEAEFDGKVGLGRRGRFTEGTTAAVQLFYVFESPDAVDIDAVQTYVSEHSGDDQQFGEWVSTAVRQDGRLAVVEGTITRRTQ